MNHELPLVLLNFAGWLLPSLYFKGVSRMVYLAAGFIFSGSYWCLSALRIVFDGEYSTSIVLEYVNLSLYYSFCAAVSFFVPAILFSPRITRIQKGYLSVFFDLRALLPNIRFLWVMKVIAIVTMAYSLVEAIPLIGVSGRRYYIDEIAPFWHFVLLPFNGLILFLCVVYDFRGKNNSFFLTLTLLLSVFHVFLVGFDGSRRDAFFPIAGYAMAFLFLYHERAGGGKRLYWRPLISALVLVVLSSFLSINRAYDVGWVFLVDGAFLDESPVQKISIYLFSPMPTLHVNTSMIEYVRFNGEQGFSSYFYGALNTLFPRFIFGEYLFGRPLVLEIQDEMGWVGFDFGFMAEAIYSGGLSGVVVAHFVFGLCLALFLRGVNRGRVVFLALLIGLFFGMVNSLRSDFMNLLKSSLYTAFFLYVLFQVSIKRARSSR